MADFYLAATVLLAAALGAMAVCRQPAKRLAVAKAAIVALALLAGLCVLPGWSLITLKWAAAEATVDVPNQPRAIEVVPAALAPVVEVGGVVEAAPAVLPTVQSGPVEIGPSVSWLAVLVAVYLAGCGLMVVWLLLGILAAGRLVRRAEPAAIELGKELHAASDSSITRVELLVSREIDVAVAIGVFRPWVLLPQGWSESRSSDELRAILAHEFAHVRNGDLHWLAASRLLLVLLWAQPLYWWLRRQMRLDQETLADAVAAERTGRRQYVEQLVAWARDVRVRPRPLLPASVGLWEGASQLRLRVAVLLDESFTVLKKCSRRWRFGVAGLAVAAVLALSMISFAPESLTAANLADGSTREIAEQIRHSVTAYPRLQMRPGKGVLEGRCVDEEGGALAGVDVALVFDDLSNLRCGLVRHERTDGAGKFRFAELEQPATDDHTILYWIVAWSQGRASAVAGVHADQPRFVDLELSQPAAVTGRVTDADGNPVEDALVSFGSRNLTPLEGVLSARTDANGEYQVADLRTIAPKKLIKHIEENGQRFSEVQILQFQVEHPAYATADVRYSGVPATVDVVLEPAAKILGRVVFADSGKPAVDVIVRLQGVNDHSQAMRSTYDASTKTDSQGRYELTGLRRGKYNVWAATLDWTIVALDAFEVDTGEKRTAPDLQFIKGGTVEGRLVDAETGDAVEVGDSDGYVSIGVHGPSRPRSGAAIDGGRVNPDGSFKFRLPAGQHYAYLSGAGPFSVVGKDLGSRELEIRDGETTLTEFLVRREK